MTTSIIRQGKPFRKQQTTAKEVYAEFCYWNLFYKKGVKISKARILSTDDDILEARLKGKWKAYVTVANFFNEHDTIDYQNYIEYTLKFYPNAFSPKILICSHAIKKYTERIINLDFNKEVSVAYNNIAKSIQFITKFCVKHNISDFETFKNKYLLGGPAGIPYAINEICNRKISIYLLVFLKDFYSILQGWSGDAKESMRVDEKNIQYKIKIAQRAVYFKLNRNSIDVEKCINKILKEKIK